MTGYRGNMLIVTLMLLQKNDTKSSFSLVDVSLSSGAFEVFTSLGDLGGRAWGQFPRKASDPGESTGMGRISCNHSEASGQEVESYRC